MKTISKIPDMTARRGQVTIEYFILLVALTAFVVFGLQTGFARDVRHSMGEFFEAVHRAVAR